MTTLQTIRWNTKRAENLRAIVCALHQRGVECYLNAAHEFAWRAVKGVLGESEKTALDVIRPSLTAYLRLEACLCQDCGARPAARPARDTLWCEDCYWTRVDGLLQRCLRPVKTNPCAEAIERSVEDVGFDFYGSSY